MASSSSSPPMKHQVFLSFRGEDTRLNFTAHLREALKGKGLDVFFDEEKLERGEHISPALYRAIEASRLSIIVLSSDYASSKSCLAELSDIIDCKSTHGHIVLPIFYHVDPSDVRNFGGSFKTSFDDHESNRPLDEVKRWKAAFAGAGKLKGWHIEGGKFDRSETEYIKDIVDYVIKKLMSSYFRSASEELVGIDDQKKTIMGLIEQEDCRVIGLWGMGGIGKTTLADAVYKEVSAEFQDRCFLQNVSEKIEKEGRESLRNELLSELLNQKDIRIDTPSIGYPYKERLNNKKVLVVLDDVTDSDQIDFMGVRNFGHGSKIIITSRERQVLKNGGTDNIHEVNELNEEDSFQLFSTFAFKLLNPAVDFRDLSSKFVKYARGNPLALKIMGSKLYTKSREQWESEMDKLKQYLEPKILHILKSSFDGLDELEKNIFLDIACLYKGSHKSEILEILCSYYKGAMSGISNLIDKCLLDITSYGGISMHDMLEEMARDIVCQESKHPEERSRLWNPKNVYQVLKNKRLIANGVDIVSLPNELRYLWWEYYPFKSLSLEFNPKNLFVLKLYHGNMEQLWNEDYQDLVNLRVIDVSFSKNLRKIPNILGAINLRILCCQGCESLVELPCLNHLTYLQTLQLDGCLNFKKLPELPNDIGELLLSNTKIKEVPNSIEHLVGLESLDFTNCPIVKFPKIPRNIEVLDLSGTQIEEVSSPFDPSSNLQCLSLSHTRVKNVSSNILKLESLISLDLSRCPVVEFPGVEVPSPILMFKRLECLRMVNCESLKVLTQLPPNLKYLNAHGCTSLGKVFFDHQNLRPFDGEADFFMIFSNCFGLNQDSIDNIEANVMLNIQSLAGKWASRYDQQFSPNSIPELLCCFPGNKISANRFEHQSMNSSLHLKMAPSGTSVRRFLGFVICLVTDLTRCYRVENLKFNCEYQLKFPGGIEKFESEISFGRIQWTEQKCDGNHVLILCGTDMVREDKNYEEASFEFYIKHFNDDKEENIKVEKCGVHVFNQNFDSHDDANIEEAENRPATETRLSYIGGEEEDRGSKRLKYSHSSEDATSQ
ncbi:hypothetical protein V6N13_055824 [Hibiscus sabdariffa]